MFELLLEAKTCGVHIDLVLLDKGFCWREVIAALETSEYKFLAAAKRDKQVKEAILDYFRTGKGQVRRFSKGKDEERSPLTYLFTGSRNVVAGVLGIYLSFMGLLLRT